MLNILKRKKKQTVKDIVNQVIDHLINENNKMIISVPENRRGHYVVKGLGLNDAKNELNEVFNALKIK